MVNLHRSAYRTSLTPTYELGDMKTTAHIFHLYVCMYVYMSICLVFPTLGSLQLELGNLLSLLYITERRPIRYFVLIHQI